MTAEGVLVHQSEFMQTNAVVVEGRTGVLVIDPGYGTARCADTVRDRLSDAGAKARIAAWIPATWSLTS